MILLFSGLLMVFFLTACSVPRPQLNSPFFPESYHTGRIDKAAFVTVSPSVSVIMLNRDTDLNRRVLRFWEDGYLNEAFHRVQPMSTIYGEDIENLSVFINRIFRIFLVAVSPRKPVSAGQLKKSMIQTLQCDPMTNLEIRFLMSANLPAPFSKKPLSMLLISSHELALQAGAEPVYPQLFSPYLRKMYQLPPLKDLEVFNLFATKNENKVYLTSRTGFIVCHKQADNHQPKPAGPP